MQQEVERMRAQHDDRLALMYREKSLTLNDLQLNRCEQTKTRLEPSTVIGYRKAVKTQSTHVTSP